MPTQKQLIGLTAIIGLLAFSVTAQAQLPSQTIYKWTDENGVVHYEMRKPANNSTPVEVIKKRLAEPSDAAPASTASNSPSGSADNTNSSSATPAADKPKKDPKICELATSNLEQLQNRRHVSVVDEYGNEKILDEKEVTDQIKRAQEAVKANCN